MDSLPPQQPQAASRNADAGRPDEEEALQNTMMERQENILRTPQGDVEYPGLVPPEVESPDVALKRPASVSGREPDSSFDDAPERHATSRSVSHKLAPIQHTKSSPMSSRPTATRQWQTELPDGRARQIASRSRPGQRQNQSYLGTALWETRNRSTVAHDGASSSSSSSESESEDEPTRPPPRTLKTGYRPQGKGVEQKQDRKNRFGRFNVGNDNYHTKGKVKKDGRLAISVQETANTGYLAKALGSAVHKLVNPDEPRGHDLSQKASHESLTSDDTLDISPMPRLNIVIMVIGSRGDIQPFLKVGRVLKEQYGHRVRIATHPAFRDFVQKDSGLEFFSVGGDPSELMAFMVKNPGLIPNIESVKAGDIGKRRAAMAEMFDGFWRACINATDDEKNSHNLKMMGTHHPFVADAIIANPPSFAHVHCAEALGIPLHMMFTFPYTPTQSFPHPLASIKRSNVDPGYTNFISYPLVEMMVWQGLGDLVNDFRVKTLCLDPVSTLWAPGATYRLHVPFTYMWSPGLVSKPPDWGPEIDVAGFVFLDLASSFQPSKELEDFLNAGEKPIYIGFGSIVVDDAEAFTQMIFKAVEMAGVRALVSQGWGGLGGENVPDNVFMLGNVPHDWLFPRVTACVIHGGAGTTAIALKTGKPLQIVPFFGDQSWWGKMVANAGAGPEPVPYKELNAEKLAEGIKFCLTDDARLAAEEIAASIDAEGDGAENAVKSFHKHLRLSPPNSMRCSVFKNHIAAWQPKGSNIKLSPMAADMLVSTGHLSWKRLRLYRHTEWNDFEGPGEPVTGVAGSLAGTVGNAFGGIASVPKRMAKTTKKRKTLEALAAKANRNDSASDSATNGKTPAAAKEGQKDTATGLPHTNTQPMTTEEAAGEYVGDVTSGIGRAATAIVKAPVDLSLALAQGFHNAPRLYGDDTVRRPNRVTGIKSGLRAAGREFGYGIYDGFTGVVRLPVRGAKQNGPVGFVKGTGMGLLGFVLKNSSAIIGPFGYTLKGVVKQAERRKQPMRNARRGRIVQGQREAHGMEEKERDASMGQAIENWTLLKELEAEIAHGERGFAGQVDKVFIDTKILFEDIDVAKQALQALKTGQSLEQVTRDVLGVEPRRKSFDPRRSKSLRRSLDPGGRSRKSLSLSTRANGSSSALSSRSKKSLRSPTRREDTRRLSSTMEARDM